MVKYNNVVPLSISSRSWGSVDDNCFNKYIKSENQIDIKNNVINTNFESGNIYIQYYTSMMNKDGEYLVPEDEIIRTAFLEGIKEVALEYLLLNTSLPIQQIYGMQVQKATKALNEAYIRSKTPGYQDTLNIGNYMKKRFNRYWNVVNTPKPSKYKY